MNKCPYIVGNECDIDRCNNFFDRAELLDKVAEKIREDCGIYFDNDYSSSNQEPMYLCSEIDEVIAELKAEVEE